MIVYVISIHSSFSSKLTKIEDIALAVSEGRSGAVGSYKSLPTQDILSYL